MTNSNMPDILLWILEILLVGGFLFTIFAAGMAIYYAIRAAISLKRKELLERAMRESQWR